MSRDDARLLQHPRQAATAVDDARGDDGSGRASIEALSTGTTTVVDGGRSDGKRGGGDHAAEHEPTARTWQQEVGVLAEPADAGLIRDLTINDAVVICKGHRLEAVGAQPTHHRPQRLAQRCVVINPRVATDACDGARRARWLWHQIRLRRNEHRLGIANRAFRVGRSLRVLEGEFHAVGEAGGNSIANGLAGPVQHFSGRHPGVRDPERFREANQFVQVGGIGDRERRISKPHDDEA